jgi:hypothetical protein
MSDTHTHVWATLEDGSLANIMGKSRDFKLIAGMLYRAGVHSTMTKFCALAKSRVEVIKDRQNWIHIDDFIKQKIAEWTSRPMMLSMAAAEASMPQLGKLVEQLHTGLMYENRELLSVRQKTDYHNVVKVLKVFGHAEGFDKTVKECKEVRWAIEKQYPMLSLVDTSSKNAKILLDYITMVDNATTTGEE